MKECCAPLTGIAVYAEDPRVIVSAYIAAFLAWSILFKFDFISEKWRSISSVEISGFCHLIITIPPISIIIFYTYVQGLAGDIKEMMTAIVSLCLALFHIFRTFWGLLQLAAFKNWCKDSIRRLKLIGIRFSAEEENLRRSILVNNSVVDNEFSGNELKVTFSPQKLLRESRILSTSEPDLCTFRWMAPFLCAYGHKLTGLSSKSDIKHLFRTCRHSLETLLYVVFPGNESIEQKSMFSAHEIISKSRNRVGAYGSDMPEYKFISSNERYELEFNSQLGTFSKTRSTSNIGDPENACIQLSDSVLFSKLCGIEQLDNFKSFRDCERNNIVSPVLIENGWKLLLEQNFEIDLSEDEATRHYMKLPPFPWFTMMLPLWELRSNTRILQASVRRDNFTALDNANNVESKIILAENTFEYSLNIQRDKLEHVKTLYRFSGCILESVRSFLAEWVDNNPIIITEEDWLPKFQDNIVLVHVISLSQFCVEIGDENEVSLRRDERLIWELQKAIHELVQKDLHDGDRLPKCPSIICLFILGFPCLTTKFDLDEEDEQKVISIIPRLRVQNISLQVKINHENCSGRVLISFDGEEKIFRWNSWVNSALGIMKGWDDARKERGSRNIRQRLLQEVHLTRPVVNFSASNGSFVNLEEGSVKIWKGWPSFDLKICSFEMNNWLSAKRGDLGNSINKQMLKEAEDSLEHFIKNTLFNT